MLVFQMRNVDKTSTVLKQTKNSDTQINKYVRLIPTSD
ncbi:23S rRNA methyltransferase attenuation leader peptide [Anaerobutyricum hallii]|uniref:23S rRNA methyltransferase attenuation leader peptide n=2 Tax=Bacillota TaxID=1239 RepID=A0A413PU98_9FIRM|nr:23S rRNA methyltransferase attenuation leader peptide [Firmicutes bacterium AM55-24TS]RGZ80130.1 23S rRNA methyltransferase attenuation leader peptide [Anaerobutyricum hallii]RHE82374.1 23S rRNA methyltransferase attenuation leader peptide [Streptococcus anginosus]RHO73342.1 23S rRNA methyltransferase attenuation leader peptide [Clostridium sp. AF43-10]RHQ54007.1 23S rRNA methyltransferase attenuation leader peptide [Blautia sp. AF25-12LB]